MKSIPGVFLLAVAATVCLTAAPCAHAGPEAVCDGTLAAWRQDRSMQQYLNDYECSCSNGNSSPPVCRARSSGAQTSTYGGGGGVRKKGPSDEQLVLRELQSQMDQMFKTNWQAYRKYQQESLRNAGQIHRDQQAALRAEEERREKAALEEEARRRKEAAEVHSDFFGIPASGGDKDILGITAALDEDARKKQLAQCPGMSEKIARYENGIRRIDEVMARNDRMLRDAEADGRKAREELAKVKTDAAAEALSMGLKSFVQTQKSLQNMKDLLNKAQGGGDRNYGQMSYDQVRQAQKWLDRGLTHGQNVVDLTQKSLEYRKTTSLRGNEVFAASPYDEQLKAALKDFNDKFLYDAGGLEFIGENLASAMGPAWEISFKAAVAGIHATAAGIGMKISGNQMRVFDENQDRMAHERYRLEQRIAALKESFVNNRCPAQAGPVARERGASSAATEGR